MITIETEKQRITLETGERIRYFRQMRGLSQEALALKIGMSPSYLGHLERGLKCPTVDTIYRVSNALGISLSDFFDYHYDNNAASFNIARIKLAISKIPVQKTEHFIRIIEELAELYEKDQ